MGEGGPHAYEADGETPVAATVEPFELSPTSVTNDEFATFVDATGYVTDAERFEWSFVFAGLLPDDFVETRGVVGAQWWRQVFAATWRAPEGPWRLIEVRADHPVVHVSYNDAVAYTTWSATRLPSEAEWEFAARGGSSTRWSWGDDREPDGVPRMNVFVGEFPNRDSEAHWRSTCPVRSYEPNAFGFWNMVGNVWEWTADAFVPGYRHIRARIAEPVLMKGGSYLCHESYCRRYRPAARMGSSAESSAGNVGFRVAR